MNKILKVLTLATLFTLPLAACGDNKDDKGKGGEESEEVTLEDEALRIASEMFEMDVDDIVIADYESEDEGDVYEYNSSDLHFFQMGFYDEMTFKEAVADVKSYLPSGAKKDTANSEGEVDDSDDDCTYKYFIEMYSKDGIGYDLYTDYYTDPDYDPETFTVVAVFDYSQLDAYIEFVSSFEE